MPAPEADTRRAGLLFGAGAYVWWGLSPGFFPLLLPAGSLEVLAHRIVWSALLLLVVLIAVRRLGDLRRLTARTWLQLAVASVLISINWGTYIYAATHGHVVDAALGYFINPLVCVALGVLVFSERLRRWQLVALALAVAAVVLLTVEVGTPPLHRARAGVVVRLLRIGQEGGAGRSAGECGRRDAAGAAVRRRLPGRAAPRRRRPLHRLRQLAHRADGAAGPVTAVPLLLFAAAAQRLPLVTLGLLFYLNPGLQMIWGVLVGHEPMPVGRWIGFGLIWLALAVFTVDALRRRGTPAAADRVQGVEQTNLLP